MEIESEALMPVNLDGELVHLKKVEFSIAEKALRFIIPQGNC